MNQKFFCPAPWTSVYYHKDTVISPCHTNRESDSLNLSEYIKSDWLKNIQSDFLNGKVPESCNMCFVRESKNLKSTRQAFLRYQKYTDDSLSTFDPKTQFNRIELRASNLCNFKCRMCDSASSSEFQKEIEKYPILEKFNNVKSIKFDENSENIEELKWFIDNYPIEQICFTGGEPMLMKPYYQLMDYIIEKGMNDKITLDLFTNCSVYNSLFVDRILQFKRVLFCMSIDGIGKTAEYQRHGTKWPIVEKNVLRYTKMPMDIMYNTSISPYVLLDVSSLAKFLMMLYEHNGAINSRCYAVVSPKALHFENMNADLRKMAYEQIDKAVEILTPSNFDIFTKELLNIKHRLETTEPVNPTLFAQYTQVLDVVRDESFEEVFGYKLY